MAVPRGCEAMRGPWGFALCPNTALLGERGHRHVPRPLPKETENPRAEAAPVPALPLDSPWRLAVLTANSSPALAAPRGWHGSHVPRGKPPSPALTLSLPKITPRSAFPGLPTSPCGVTGLWMAPNPRPSWAKPLQTSPCWARG